MSATSLIGPEKEDKTVSQVHDLAQKGMIEIASSVWSYPVELAKKNDGKWHLCVDYR